MATDECPLRSCDEPWSQHDNFKRMVHKDRAEYEAPPKWPGKPNGCRCPILSVGDYCPIHGG